MSVVGVKEELCYACFWIKTTSMLLKAHTRNQFEIMAQIAIFNESLNNINVCTENSIAIWELCTISGTMVSIEYT